MSAVHLLVDGVAPVEPVVPGNAYMGSIDWSKAVPRQSMTRPSGPGTAWGVTVVVSSVVTDLRCCLAHFPSLARPTPTYVGVLGLGGGVRPEGPHG